MVVLAFRGTPPLVLVCCPLLRRLPPTGGPNGQSDPQFEVHAVHRNVRITR